MVKVYRKYYPQNELRILTNAIRILEIEDEIWDCIRENNVVIHISLYPPLKSKKNEIEKRLREKRILYLIDHEVETFLKHWTLYPFEDEDYNLSICGSAGCHYLRDGEIAKCPDAILIGNMKDDLISKNNISLLSTTAKPWEIIDILEAPIDLCKKCSFKRAESIRWEHIGSNAQCQDWLVKNRYEYENDKLKEQIAVSQKELEKMIDESEKKNIVIDEFGRMVKLLQKNNECASIEIEHMTREIEMERREAKELKKDYDLINKEMDRLLSSWSYKSGRALTYIPRKLRRIVSVLMKNNDRSEKN